MHPIGSKIRPIRECLGLGRAEFADIIGVKKQMIIGIEQGKQRPTEEVIAGIGRKWPEFAFWLVTGKEMPEAGHISPDTEKISQYLEQRRQSIG